MLLRGCGEGGAAGDCDPQAGVAVLGLHPWEVRTKPSSSGCLSGVRGSQIGMWRLEIPVGLTGLKADS